MARDHHDHLPTSIRVLVADRVPESRDATVREFASSAEFQVVAVASDGDAALTAALQERPDVVIMDTNLPGVDGLRATELLVQRSPNAAVILISDQNDVGLLRRGMQAGARDFLIRPLGPGDLIASVRAVFDQEVRRLARQLSVDDDTIATRPTTNGKVICFFSPKGGVGRTTVAINTAIAIRQMTGQRVAIVDCNLPFGDIGIIMNLAATKTIADLLPSIGDLSPEVLDSFLREHESGVRVLLAPTRPELAELFHPEHIRTILEALRREYDYVLVDTWTSFHEVILALFDLSSEIVLLTTLDMPAIKNIRLFLDVCDGIRYPKERVTLVLNRADSLGGLRIEDIEESIQHRVTARLSSAGPLVTASINRGMPFIMSDPDAPLSREVFDLARQLLRPEDRAAVEPAPSPVAPVARRATGLSRLVPGFQSRR